MRAPEDVKEPKESKIKNNGTFPFNTRQFKFLYILGWITAQWIRHGTNPSILSKLNTGMTHGGKSAQKKSEVYGYLTKDNDVAKRYMVKSTRIPHNMSWENAKTVFKTYGKSIVFKPDTGSRSIGVRAFTTESKKRQFLKARGKTDYIIQEYISYRHELGVFYYRYPSWKKGKILGIAEKKIGEMSNRHKRDQYTDRPDLITEEVIDTFNKIVGNKEIYFCRFDIRTENFGRFKKGKGFKILEANAGPDAVLLHTFDSRYHTRRQLQRYTQELKHAFNIAGHNDKAQRGDPRIGIIRYVWFLIKDELPLQYLRFRLRNIRDEN